MSCEGIPFGSSRNLPNHFSFAVPNVAISSQVLAPQIAPHMAMTMISINLCSFWRSMRGSALVHKKAGTVDKQSRVRVIDDD